MPTALEIAQGRQTVLSAGLLQNVITEAPLFSAMDVRTSPDVRFLTLAIDSLPTSSFRRLGEGLAAGNAKLSVREASCSIIGGLVQAEVQSQTLWDRAHAASGVTWFGLQCDARVKSDILNVERQLIQGLANDPKGFPGARDITPFATANIFNMTQTAQSFLYQRSVLNAGYGASLTANTASSVYAFRMGLLESQMIIGNDLGSNVGGSNAQPPATGELFQFSNVNRQYLPVGDSTPPTYLLYDLAELEAHIGFSVGGFSPSQVGQSIPTQYSLRRAANLTADSGATLNDGIMDKLARSFKPGLKPNLFAMAVRSGEQLARSRQATAVNFIMNGGGDAKMNTASLYPPPPDNWQGIPIVYPLCIGESDAVEVAS